MANNYLDNPWYGFAEDQPEMMYRAMLPGSRSTNFLDYFKSRYGDVYKDYESELGKMALSGQAPSLNFYDYLKQYPFLNEWFSQSSRQRGEPTPARTFWNIKF